MRTEVAMRGWKRVARRWREEKKCLILSFYYTYLGKTRDYLFIRRINLNFVHFFGLEIVNYTYKILIIVYFAKSSLQNELK